MQNGICEAFNGCMRNELLNETIFYDLDHARSALARWTAGYNQKRPTQPSVISPRRPSRETSPQRAIGCADRPLLRRRSGANLLICSPKTGPFGVRVSAVFSPGWDERKMMKASRFSDAQKAFILKQGNDAPVAEICRKAGISQATYFNWKKKYDGMQPPEMRRLKQLEDENSKLKKIVADLSLDREMLQDVIRRKL
jgi:putative transposase